MQGVLLYICYALLLLYITDAYCTRYIENSRNALSNGENIATVQVGVLTLARYRAKLLLNCITDTYNDQTKKERNMVGYIIGRILIGLFLLLVVGGVAAVIILVGKYFNQTPEEIHKQDEKINEIQAAAYKKKIARQSVEVKATEPMIQSLISQHSDNPFINNPITITTAEKIAEAFFMCVCRQLTDKTNTYSVFLVNHKLNVCTDGVYGDFSIYYKPGRETFISFKHENLAPIENYEKIRLFADALKILSRELFEAEYQKNSVVCKIQDYNLSFCDREFTDSRISIDIEFKASNPNYESPKEWN